MEVTVTKSGMDKGTMYNLKIGSANLCHLVDPSNNVNAAEDFYYVLLVTL